MDRLLGISFRVVVVAPVVLSALAMGVIPSVSRQEDAGRTITIYAAECPLGYVGDASADECDECDDNPSAGVPFRVGRPFTDAFTDFVPTDGEGLVTFGFDGLPLDGTLRVIEQIPAGIGHFVAYCVDESGGELGVTYPDYAESSPGIGVADVAVGTADNVLCDWYNVPRATASSEDRTPLSGEEPPCSIGVRLASDPQSWIIPNASGYGDPDYGRLWFGVLVENCSQDEAVGADVIFRSYKVDGTPYEECSRISPLDLGAGAADNIAPGDTAWVTCDAGDTPRSLGALQVTARIREVLPRRQATAVDYVVMEAGFATDPVTSDPMGTGYAPSALVRSTRDDADTLAWLLFRFYDERGVHVGSCASDAAVVEPGISRRVTCSYPIRIDAESPQPVSVEAVPLPCDVPPESGPVLSGRNRLGGCS